MLKIQERKAAILLEVMLFLESVLLNELCQYMQVHRC